MSEESLPAGDSFDSTESLRLVDQYRRGDPDAAGALFARYVGRLTSLAHSRLSSKLARRIDAEDIVQSAYRSFFLRARDGQYTLQQSGDLWRLLAVITMNKLRRKVEHHTAGKRQVDQEQNDSGADGRQLYHDAITREPSPAETLAVLEEVDLLTRGLTDVQKRMVELRLQGYLIEEIAEEVARSERTVRRVLDKVKLCLEQRLEESSVKQ
ncbi:MAG: LuxR family transcriptional regulator [Planctomycetes bacterium]|nr:LuxR family transcriptional regulator [Planctomycetota bacterium]